MLKLADHTTELTGLDLLDRDDLIAMVKRMVNGGVSLSFHGKRAAMEIARRVRPRVTRRMNDLHVGTPEDQSKNLLIEGENLQAMVTLYKYRGQVDLLVTDPPYNTGQYFRYNDRWDEDPNDPELGTLVTLPKSGMQEVLEGWGSKYVEKDIKDGRAKAFMIVGAPTPKLPRLQKHEMPVVESDEVSKHPVIVKARKAAEKIRDNAVWPVLYFNSNGYDRPRTKRYLAGVKKGKVPLTCWADEDY